MGSRAKKKVRTLPQEFGEGDRLSRLPDELIHKILSFVDAKEAVQTTILSRRWEAIWTTLPFLSFGGYDTFAPKNVSKFMRHVLSNRNHQSHISDLNLRVYNKGCSKHLVEKYVEYAISHNVQTLTLELPCGNKPNNFEFSTLSSKSLKKLTLEVRLQECLLKSNCWDLPALTTLHLKNLYRCKFSDTWFTCLPSLRTLCLDSFDLSQSSFSFSLPALTTLCLSRCKLPTTVWDFPALTSIQLDDVDLPENLNDMFSALVNLQNLTLFLTYQQKYLISCPPQLLNLSIRARIEHYHPYSCKSIVVSAPKLCNFTSFGIFIATVVVPELENVNVRLQGLFHQMDLTRMKQIGPRLTNMLPGLGNAKNLTFDLDSIKAFNKISNLFVSLPSPFCKLKYVKLPRGFKESSISSPLRSYLLGGSPNATFVTELPQNHGVEDSMVDADRVRHIDASVEGTNKDQASSLRGERDSGLSRSHEVNSEFNHGVEDSMVDADSVRHIDASAEGTNKDQASSLRGERDNGLWRSHEVNSEFVCLLDRIMHKYPETFEHFTTKNKKLCTMNLNMLCTSLNDFSKISIANVDSEMIVEYREVFSYLQNHGFNLSWAVDRLNYIEHLRFSKPLINELHSIDCHIDDAKTKVQELQAHADDAKIKLQDLLARVDDAKIRLQDRQTLRVEKLSEIEKVFGTMGTNVVVGFIGDDLL